MHARRRRATTVVAGSELCNRVVGSYPPNCRYLEPRIARGRGQGVCVDMSPTHAPGGGGYAGMAAEEGISARAAVMDALKKGRSGRGQTLVGYVEDAPSELADDECRSRASQATRSREVRRWTWSGRTVRCRPSRSGFVAEDRARVHAVASQRGNGSRSVGGTAILAFSPKPRPRVGWS